jgi:hypothetical protein
MVRGRILILAILVVTFGAGFLIWQSGNVFHIVIDVVAPTSTPSLIEKLIDPNADIEPQPQLANPPAIIKAIYATGYSAGSSKKVNYFTDLLNTTELNAIVLDIKDYTGDVSYKTDIPQVNEYGAWEKKIPRINSLIKRFHDDGVYVIGRIAVFQDQKLVQARPDLALRSSSTGEIWRDYKKVAWLDTASKEVWDYNIAIAKDALARGFDEINFDYIRFASDGNLKDIKYPFFDETTLKHNTVKKFFEYVHKQLPDAQISGDLFGLVTEDLGDMGIGQHLEDAMGAFDVIAPMTYPSHYAAGYRNFANPANYPYEVMKFAMDSAIARLKAHNEKIAATQASLATTTSSSSVAVPTPLQPVDYSSLAKTTFRPWIQDFNLGATYTPEMVRAQINAIYDAGCAPAPSSTPRTAPCSDAISGWLVWNPSNNYTRAALLPQ